MFTRRAKQSRVKQSRAGRTTEKQSTSVKQSKKAGHSRAYSRASEQETEQQAEQNIGQQSREIKQSRECIKAEPSSRAGHESKNKRSSTMLSRPRHYHDRPGGFF